MMALTRADFQTYKSFYVDEINKADSSKKRYTEELTKLQAKCPHPFGKWYGRGGPLAHIRCDDCLGDAENNRGWKTGEHFHNMIPSGYSSDTHNEYRCSCDRITMVLKD